MALKLNIETENDINLIIKLGSSNTNSYYDKPSTGVYFRNKVLKEIAKKIENTPKAFFDKFFKDKSERNKFIYKFSSSKTQIHLFLEEIYRCAREQKQVPFENDSPTDIKTAITDYFKNYFIVVGDVSNPSDYIENTLHYMSSMFLLLSLIQNRITIKEEKEKLFDLVAKNFRDVVYYCKEDGYRSILIKSLFMGLICNIGEEGLEADFEDEDFFKKFKYLPDINYFCNSFYNHLVGYNISKEVNYCNKKISIKGFLQKMIGFIENKYFYSWQQLRDIKRKIEKVSFKDFIVKVTNAINEIKCVSTGDLDKNMNEIIKKNYKIVDFFDVSGNRGKILSVDINNFFLQFNEIKKFLESKNKEDLNILETIKNELEEAKEGGKESVLTKFTAAINGYNEKYEKQSEEEEKKKQEKEEKEIENIQQMINMPNANKNINSNVLNNNEERKNEEKKEEEGKEEEGKEEEGKEEEGNEEEENEEKKENIIEEKKDIIEEKKEDIIENIIEEKKEDIIEEEKKEESCFQYCCPCCKEHN